MKDDITLDVEAIDGVSKQQTACNNVEVLLEQYRSLVGDGNDDQTTLSDLLADLMHWAAANDEPQEDGERGVNFDFALETATRHFRDEHDETPRLTGLAAAKAVVLEAVPDATGMHLQTSDQAYYGFVLADVVLADGGKLSDTDPDRLATLGDDAHEHLCDLNWNAEVGENKAGEAYLLFAQQA